MTFTIQDELQRIGDLLEAILKKLEEAPAPAPVPVQVTYMPSPAPSPPIHPRATPTAITTRGNTVHSCSGRGTYVTGSNGGNATTGTWSFPIGGTTVGKTIT